MDKKEIKARVAELVAAGTGRQAVFDELKGQGLKDNRLAYLVAACPDKARTYAQDRKINVLITLMFLQAAVAFLVGYGMGTNMGPGGRLTLAVVVAMIPLLFAWTFYKDMVGGYNAYILLTIIQLPRSFEGLGAAPVATLVAVAVNIALLAFVWYLRQKLFPDFVFMGPKKIKGQYVFSS